jgi:hypothetical protein
MAIGQEKYYDPNRERDRRRSSLPEGKKSFVVGEMYDRHHEIARRLLLGQKNTEIAEALNITAQSVSQVKNSPVVQDKLTLMKAARDCGAIDLAMEIASIAPIALGKIREAIELGSVNGQELSADSILKQSNTILDRHIGKPTQTINAHTTHTHLSLEDIERIKARAQSLSGAVTLEASYV